MSGNMELKGVCGACGETAVAVIEVKGMEPLTGPTPGQWMEPDGAGYIEKRKKGKGKKIRTLGAVAGKVPAGEPAALDPKVVKSDDEHLETKDADGLEEEDITLEDIQDFSETFFDAKTLDSALGVDENMFIVQMEQKDGRVFEALFDASTAQMKALYYLDFNQKSDSITSENAKEIALKNLEGDFVDVNASSFENQDAWAVGVNGKDGNFYDVFVSTGGTYLGYDTFVPKEKAAKPKDDMDDDDASPAPEDNTDPIPTAKKKDTSEKSLGDSVEDNEELLKQMATLHALSLELE